MRPFSPLILFLTIIIPNLTCLAEQENGLEAVKQRTIDLLTLGDGIGPHRMQVVRQNDAWCDRFLGGEPIRLVPEDWNLPRINYKVVARSEEWRRVAVAYQTVGSRYYQDPSVLEPLFDGLSNILDYFNPETPKPGNWHPWLIVIPMNLGELGILMEDVLPSPLLKRLEKSLADELQEMRLNGANAAWEARNHAYLALLQRDPDRLGRAAAQVFRPVRYTYGSGVREDFSHMFHGHIPYAGGYGAGFAQTVSQFLLLFDQSPWAPKSDKAELIANFLLEHALYFIHAGYLDPHITGRAYACGSTAGQLTEATLFMTQADTSRREELKAAAIQLISSGAPVSEFVAHFADRLPLDLEPRQLNGFRYWYCSEMGVYKGDGFHIGFRQYSTRVQDYEFLTQTGGEGWNLAYGFTYITRNGREWYPEGLHPGVDPYYLPGSTTRLAAHPINATEGGDIGDTAYSLNYGRSRFAGAAGHGDGGVAGFILIPAYGNFIANKSLHFFPEGYWAIGSAIRSTESNPPSGPVITPLIQWPLPADSTLLLDGQQLNPANLPATPVSLRTLLVDGIGICFTEETQVQLAYANGVFRAWLDHGTHPVNDSYAYALVPNTDAARLATFAESPPVQPITAGETIHAVRDTRRGATSAVFFKAGTLDNIGVDQPAIVYHVLTDSGASCSIQNPLHTASRIQLDCPAPGETGFMDKEVRRLVTGTDAASDRFEIESNIGRIYRFATGSLGQSVQSLPRVDMESMHRFKVSAENSPAETLLQVYIPREALDEGYELTLSGHKGHLLKVFSENDIVSRNGSVITYRWDRAAAEPGVPDIMKQRFGDFRLYLRTELKASIDYFTIPAYDGEGNIDRNADLPRDRNKP